MTTLEKKKKSANPSAKAAKRVSSTKKAPPRKSLRIREELLPQSAAYATLAGREYVMIPVDEFGDWYEDALDAAVGDYIQGLGDEPLSEDDFWKRFDKPQKGRQQ